MSTNTDPGATSILLSNEKELSADMALISHFGIGSIDKKKLADVADKLAETAAYHDDPLVRDRAARELRLLRRDEIQAVIASQRAKPRFGEMPPQYAPPKLEDESDIVEGEAKPAERQPMTEATLTEIEDAILRNRELARKKEAEQDDE